MYKKRILGLAIASSIALSGCLESGEESNANAGANQNPDITSNIGNIANNSGVWPVFSPAESAFPIPNDLLFSGTNDGTFVDVAPPGTTPVTDALTALSGASTSAPIDIAMSGMVDPLTVDGNSLAGMNPNPNQNVFLIELDYASGDPLQGFSLQEPPTVTQLPGDDYEAEVKTLDGTSYIRINLKTPLKPLTRYVVALTDGIKDLDGNSIHASPGVAGYAALTDEDAPLASSALAPIKALINGLWEPLALGYIDATTNQTRAALMQDPITVDNVALSYSFMTSGDEKVLNYIADPKQWFEDQLSGFLGLTAVKMVTGYVNADTNEDYSPGGAQHNPALFGDISADGMSPGQDGNVDYLDMAFGVAAATGAFPSADIQAALNPLFSVAPPNGCQGTTGTAAIGCIATALTSAPVAAGGFADLLPTPVASSTITVDTAGTLDAYAISSLPASLLSAAMVPPGTVSVTQGTISIPYYLGVPAGANGLPLLTESWEADDTLATAINTAFAPLGLAIPQADPMVSTVVNYVFPFPKKKGPDAGNVTIPFLAIHPSNPTGPMKTVMYQHGITTDRSAALAFGSSLVAGALGAATEVAVIAIDQPLHGIDGTSPEEQAALAEQLMNVADIIDSSDGVDTDEQDSIDAVVAGVFSAVVVQRVDAATNSGAMGATSCVDLATDGLTTTTMNILGEACDADPVVTAAIGGTASTTVFSAQSLERTIDNGGSVVAGLGKGSADERHFGFTANATPGAAPVAMDYTGSSAANGSGSMFINLTSFATSRDNIRQQVLDLLAVRKSLGAIDLNAGAANGDLDDSDVYFIGHSLGTVNGIPFVAVANDANQKDGLGAEVTADNIVAANMLTPGGGISRLLENSPSFAPRILPGLAGQGLTPDTFSYQGYMNVIQATLDAGDAINFASDFDGATPVLYSIVLGDTTIPNSVDTAAEVLGDGSISFNAGSEPLVLASGADANVISTAGANPLSQSVTRYTEGFHGTPVFPSTGSPEEQAAFAEMVSQATSLVVSDGAQILVTDTDVIETP